MVIIDPAVEAMDLLPAIDQLWDLSGHKIRAIARDWPLTSGAPVVTVRGRYSTRGWTEWTQGFQFGSALLQFDATDDGEFLAIGRDAVYRYMATHVTHMGIHDHGFSIVSTYGTLWRLTREGRIPESHGECRYLELALAASGAVQARRWTSLATGGGFIHSFNGPHSLFVDTIRSLRSLAIAHDLGQVLLGEGDERISLLGRLIDHARSTDRYAIYRGQGRDSYDVPGRVAHESIFNAEAGQYVCPSSQQGYSPFSTWTRGLAWAILGFAEQLEYLATLPDADLEPYGGRADIERLMLGAASITSDFYLANSPTDGIPYWDTGAPGLVHLGDYLDRPADPFNDHEPVDSSAAAIGAQGLLRLGRFIAQRDGTNAARYWKAGLTVARTLLSTPYLCLDDDHHGLLLHTVYHRPNGWDHVPEGSKVPSGESSMWGDYHLRELALYLGRLARGGRYLSFFAPSAGIEALDGAPSVINEADPSGSATRNLR